MVHKHSYRRPYITGKLALNKVIIYIFDKGYNSHSELNLDSYQEKQKKQCSFSNLVSFFRIHLFNYLHLLRFLENPEKDWRDRSYNEKQLTLF